ncbi:sensor histidine kinase [Streptomyces cavernae]|uniref:sensor histidine kinase n=1 Tax=Streptomyces cavernae TaxID=2259034 RepID=UPI000FEBCCBB|nr:histidine kinase [Streptomyces cavernae]
MTHSAPAPLGQRARRLSFGALFALLGGLWLLDMELVWLQQQRLTDWLPLLTGSAAVALILVPDRVLSLEWRAGLAAAASSVLTVGTILLGQPMPDWGLLETACLLVLLARTCRSVRHPGVAVVLSAGLGAAVIDEPLRTEGTGITLTYPFLLTFIVGAAIGTGCYQRTTDARRARSVAAARLAERLQLARELHDFVAHHVTGIVAQAHAAGVIHQSSPHQIGPILRNISEAGQQTLDSMRRLVRVLREDQDPPGEAVVRGDGGGMDIQRPGEPHAVLAQLVPLLTDLVSSFSEPGGGTVARLEISAAARRTLVTPEVESAVHRVVQEALTNVRRHAPGTQATVRLERTDDGLLRVDVHNTAASLRAAVPTGGHGGYGLMGLRERAYEVGGTLTAGPGDDDGWWVIAHFPTAPEPVASAARPDGSVR